MRIQNKKDIRHTAQGQNRHYDCPSPFLYRERAVEESLGIVLDVGQHVRDRVALLLTHKFIRALVQNADADHVGIAKQIVQIAQCFLVCADQKHANEVLLIGLHLMQGQNPPRTPLIDELVDLAVAVAGDIGQNSPAFRFRTFVKEFAPGEAGNIALCLIIGDTVRLRVKASNESGIWSGSTTFTVEDGINAVFVKLNKTISGAQIGRAHV